MKLNEKYSVERLDRYNYSIVELTQGKEKRQGYYSTFESACIRALELQINTEDLNQVLSSIKIAKDEIIQTIKNARKELREDLLIK